MCVLFPSGPLQDLEVCGPRPAGTDVELVPAELSVLHGALLAHTLLSTCSTVCFMHILTLC